MSESTTEQSSREREAFEAIQEALTACFEQREGAMRLVGRAVRLLPDLERILSAAQPVAQEAIQPCAHHFVPWTGCASCERWKTYRAEQRRGGSFESWKLEKERNALAAPQPSQGARQPMTRLEIDLLAGMTTESFRDGIRFAEKHHGIDATPHHPASAEASKGVADAWLFTCKKPGTVMVYATIDPNDANHWPVDQWKSVVREDLFKRPSESVAVSAAPSALPAQAVGEKVTDEQIVATAREKQKRLAHWDYDDLVSFARAVLALDRSAVGQRAMANCHLIAAAPDLLEALEEWIEDPFTNQVKARAAIAKATGSKS